MKGYWTISIFATLMLLLIEIAINNSYYGTKTDFYSAIIVTTLLIILFIYNVIYFIVNYKKIKNLIPIVLAGFSVFLQIIAILFIVNGILWNTDTGTWSKILIP